MSWNEWIDLEDSYGEPYLPQYDGYGAYKFRIMALLASTRSVYERVQADQRSALSMKQRRL